MEDDSLALIVPETRIEEIDTSVEKVGSKEGHG